MKRLSDKLKGIREIFIENLIIDAIIFDDSNDVTIWARTKYADELCSLYLALPFDQLDVILRHTGKPGKEMEELITHKMMEDTDRPYILEFTPENELQPVKIERIAIKLSGAFDAEGEPEGSAYNVFCVEGIYNKLW
jgi:hypothetical protein